MNIDERDSVAAQFGVAPEQVERDHLISHVLAVLSDQFRDRLHFIGGTALARTHVPNGRLSEDIDLIARGGRAEMAEEIDVLMPRALGRSVGRLAWSPRLAEVRDTEAAFLRTVGGLSVKIQLLSSRNRVLWPTEIQTIQQRYRDVPPASLAVPTRGAFAAGKTATWHDRRAARDLWDLWALAGIGAINAESARLYERYGPTNRPPSGHLFDRPLDEAEWVSQLAGQTRLTVTAETALGTVRTAWEHACDPGEGPLPLEPCRP